MIEENKMADNFTRGQVAEAAAGIGAYATKTIAFDGTEFAGDNTSKSSLTTELTGDNNDMTFTSDASDGDGNDITIAYVNTGDPSEDLEVAVSGSDITVTLATDAGTAATGTITAGDVFTAGETVTIGSVVYTMVASLTTDPAAVPYEVLIGASAAASLDNLKSAINASAGAGTTYGTGTVAHPLVTAGDNADTTQAVTAKVVGTGGNAIATVTDGANAVFGAETLEGGVEPAIISTAAEIKTAIEESTPAAALVDVANAAANDGSGVVTAMAQASLAGGSDGVLTLFNVTGTVLMKLFATCSESLAGATATIKVGTATSTAGLIAQTTATDIDVHEIWHDATPDASIELSSVATEKIVNEDVIHTIATAPITDGTLTYHCIWKPISNDGLVEAA